MNVRPLLWPRRRDELLSQIDLSILNHGWRRKFRRCCIIRLQANLTRPYFFRWRIAGLASSSAVLVRAMSAPVSSRQATSCW